MTIGIICAMERELRGLLAGLENKQERRIAGNTFYSGTIGGQAVAMTCCGIGKVNAAVAAQVLCGDYSAGAVINAGIAGALADDLHIGDIVVAETAVYHDFDPAIMAQCPPHTEVLRADSRLVQAFSSHLKTAGATFRAGRVATGDQFISDAAVKDEIRVRTGGDCAEMEGTAIAHVCALNGVPFGIIRCISDGADEAIEGSYERFADETADFCAALVLAMLRDGALRLQ